MRTAHTDILKEENQRSISNFIIFSILWKYIKKYYIILILSFIFLFSSTVVDLAIPSVMRYAIDNVINSAYKFNYTNNEFISSPNGEYTLKNIDGIYYMIKNNEKVPVTNDFVNNIKNNALNDISKYSIIIISLFLCFKEGYQNLKEN